MIRESQTIQLMYLNDIIDNIIKFSNQPRIKTMPMM